MNKISNRFKTGLVVFMLCFFSGLSGVQADFDPVNDDTDIFLANPNITSQRPNILIYVDNTANWSSAFANEKAALKAVVDNLSDLFNVGLMFFPETGNPNDQVDGAYVRYGIRQMTDDNKTVLSSIVDGLDTNADRGNNATTSAGMVEVYRYFSGGNTRSGFGKVKSDYASNTDEPGGHPAVNAGIGEHPLPANPTASSEYTSPIADACQSNFLIYLSNGPASENTNSLRDAENELAALGYDTSTTINLDPSGQEGNWMDEWARYMANADINTDVDGVQNLTTYVVEVDPVATGQGDDMTALMQSVALNGNGEYFEVSSGNGGQAIVNALNTIFSEIQAVNSVFASTTLPVSVNVRGTNLNQVYIGVFRPDKNKEPRWFGNLKMYKLGFNDATSTLFLADVSGGEAENPETGFINANSSSFWTDGTGEFWSYRSPEENGEGGPRDLPDGDLVEKGGTAQQQRIAYAADQSGRNLYTCTTSCTSGDLLSATPFSTLNGEITGTNLQLETRAVSTLTGFDTQSITSLSDTKEIAGIAIVDREYFLTSLANVSISQNLTSVTSNVTHPAGSVSLSNNQVDQPIDSLTHPTSGGGPGRGRRVVTAVINAGHGLTTGGTTTISGATEPGYNGTFVITKVDDYTFTYNAGAAVQNETSPATGSPVAITTSTIVNANVVGHGFSSGATVTISGMDPSSYDDDYSISRIDDDNFSFLTAGSLQPINDDSSTTATGPTMVATAKLTAHGYADGQSVTISGANETEFNGTVTISVVDANTFTYPISDDIGDATGTIVATVGTTDITATTASSHTLTVGDTVTIAGAVINDYNGEFTVTAVPTTTTFRYNSPEPLPPTTLDADAVVFYCDTAPCNLALAVVNNHEIDLVNSTANVSVVTGNIEIEGVEDDLNVPSTTYNGSGITTASRVTDDSVVYSSQDTNQPGPGFGDMVYRYSDPLAFVNLPGHGYADADLVTIAGADQADYNGEFAIEVIDADNFFYRHNGSGATAIGPATGTITASTKTTTATTRAVSHGFVTGNVVTITGANQSDFNGNFTITKIDDNSFTYDLTENGGAVQGDATGTITASIGSATSTEVTNLINWVRGQDNFEDENGDGFSTDVRASIHGDVLHSRPAVVNYNRHGNDDDVFVFYGANDGVFRAIKGGFNQSEVGQPEPGQEVWGFIPEEHFPFLQRLRNNEPTISSANKKAYFADGTIAVLAEDNSGPDGANVPDGKLDTTVDDDSNPDRVILFISMRRGGRFIYAIDVSVPDAPRYLWKVSANDLGFDELGFSWSAPRLVNTNANSGDPVLFFAAGYDPTVEDVDPAAITAISTTSITAGATYPRNMGRGIFALDAATGNILWQAGPSASDPTSDPSVNHHFEDVTGMDFALPSDITVISDRSGSVINRGYVGDTGGNLWRIDFDDVSVANWDVTKLASIADHSDLPDENRKFMFPPDVVYSDDGYDAVLIGSGDREHPFDTSVVNRFYMFKDTNIGTSVDGSFSTLGESDLFDATSNCIQDADACSGLVGQADENPDTATAALTSADGWYVTLGSGEKVVGNAVTLNGVTFFNTNQPGSAAASSDCSSDLGIARQYKVSFEDATAILDQNIDGETDAADRSSVHPGGGYLPSPVPVMVEIDGEVHEGVISGIAVSQPPGSLLNARLRRFWFKEME